MAEGVEIIAIDPEILRAVAGDLSRVGEEVAGVGTRIAQHPISAQAFGLMNAWMAPPIAGLVSHTAEVVQLTAAFAGAVGSATAAAADDFTQNEAANTSGLAAHATQLDQLAGRAILR
jgi:hypothetical protein